MSGTASDSDAETVITEGTTDGGKVNKEKGKVSQSASSIRVGVNLVSALIRGID